MMQRWTLGLLLTGCTAFAVAQVAAEPVAFDTGAQRAIIDTIRQQKSLELDKEDASCLTRFAVTDCQNQVGVRRRQMLTDLKQQEASLNSAERKQKHAEQLLLNQQKAADSVARQQEVNPAAAKDKAIDRQKNLDDKKSTHQSRAKPIGENVPVAKSSSILDAEIVEKNRAAYLEKQKMLEKRRQDRDQRLQDHGKGAEPLPTLP